MMHYNSAINGFNCQSAGELLCHYLLNVANVLGGLGDLGEDLVEVGGVGGDEGGGEVRENLPGERLILQEISEIRKWGENIKFLRNRGTHKTSVIELKRVKSITELEMKIQATNGLSRDLL